MRRSLVVCIVAFGFAPLPSAADPGLSPIDVRVTPITAFLRGSDQTQFGALEFRGGLELVSRDDYFGSLSGLDFAPDGTLYSVADTGFWFSARLVEDAGRLTGLSDTKFGPLLLQNGKPGASKIDTDAEGLRIVVKDGVPNALVSFEQTPPTVRFYPGPDFASATPRKIPLPKFLRNIRPNEGLEAIAVAPATSPLAGATVVIAERSLDAARNHRGFILSGPRAGEFSIHRTADYDVSDAAFLPAGDLLILERRFSFSGGFAVRIRRIAGDNIQPNATVDGTVLLEADSGYRIDNLEGLAVRSGAAGETLLDLVSDNNQNMFQQTILLQFALPADPK
jgi:hypothetical protein